MKKNILILFILSLVILSSCSSKLNRENYIPHSIAKYQKEKIVEDDSSSIYFENVPAATIEEYRNFLTKEKFSERDIQGKDGKQYIYSATNKMNEIIEISIIDSIVTGTKIRITVSKENN